MNTSANTYERTPDAIIDLHGYTRDNAGAILADMRKNKAYTQVRIVTGKGTFRESGPVLRDFVKNYLERHHLKYLPAKQSDGGEGAFEVFLKEPLS